MDGEFTTEVSHAATFGGNQVELGNAGGIHDSAEVDVDWIRLWNVLRTETQIRDNAHRKIVTGSSDLVCNYQFDGSPANTGTLGGSMTLTGSPPYVYTEHLWASPDLDLYDRTHGMLWIPEGKFSRWLRIDFDWTDNPEALVKLGRLYVANAHQFERNPEYGADIWSFEDGARHDTLHGGQRIISPSTPVPGFRLPFSFDSAEEMAVFYDVVRTRGASKDVVIILDPIDHDGRRHQRIGYGTLSQRVVANLPAYEQYKSQVELRGLI